MSIEQQLQQISQSVPANLLRKNGAFVSLSSWKRNLLGLGEKESIKASDLSDEQKEIIKAKKGEFDTQKFAHQRNSKVLAAAITADEATVINRVTPRFNKAGSLTGGVIAFSFAKAGAERRNSKLASLEAENAQLKAQIAAIMAKIG